MSKSETMKSSESAAAENGALTDTVMEGVVGGTVKRPLPVDITHSGAAIQNPETYLAYMQPIWDSGDPNYWETDGVSYWKRT